MTPADDQIVTLDEMKAFLRVASIEDDNLLEQILKAAVQYVEDRCNISIGSQDREILFSHNGYKPIPVGRGPITDVGKVEFTNCDCMAFDEVTDTNLFSWIGTDFRKFLGYDGYYRIGYTAGYTADTMPESLKKTVYMVASAMYEQRGDAGFTLPMWTKQNLMNHSHGTWV